MSTTHLLRGFATACVAGLLASSCSPGAASPRSERGLVTGPPNLRNMTALVAVKPPPRIQQLLEAGAAQTDDERVAGLLRAEASGGFGSGFLMVSERQGRRHTFIVTNRHVVDSGMDADVSFNDGSSFAHSRILYIHPTQDIAVLLLQGQAPVGYGFSLAEKTPPERTLVVATGFPALGGRPSFQTTQGIVSNAEFHYEDQPPNTYLIQHTAPTDPGSSGGPLTDDAGRVIGVNVALAEGRQNANFAVPASAVREAIAGAEEVLAQEHNPEWLKKNMLSACSHFVRDVTHQNWAGVYASVGLDFTASEGPAIFDVLYENSTGDDHQKFTDMFVKDPVMAYRVALLIDLDSILTERGGVASDAACDEVNPVDLENVGQGGPVRVGVTTAKGSLQLAFAFERGAFRLMGGEGMGAEPLLKSINAKKKAEAAPAKPPAKGPAKKK